VEVSSAGLIDQKGMGHGEVGQGDGLNQGVRWGKGDYEMSMSGARLID